MDWSLVLTEMPFLMELSFRVRHRSWDLKRHNGFVKEEEKQRNVEVDLEEKDIRGCEQYGFLEVGLGFRVVYNLFS